MGVLAILGALQLNYNKIKENNVQSNVPNQTQEENRTQKKMCMWPKLRIALPQLEEWGCHACGPCTQEEDVHVAQGRRIALPQLEEWGCYCMRP